MLRRFASTAFVFGALLTTSLQTTALAAEHGGRSGGGHGSSAGRSYGGGGYNRGQSFSGGGSRNFTQRAPSGGNYFSGGRTFVSPPRYGYSRGPSYYGRNYVAPRYYGRPAYRGYYGSGIYLGFGAPYYGYSYDPGYYYDPGYVPDPGYAYGPAPAPVPQGCSEGSYDQYGTWIPNPNCYSGQSQYQAPPPNYNSNQQPYPPQQNYDSNRAQPYGR